MSSFNSEALRQSYAINWFLMFLHSILIFNFFSTVFLMQQAERVKNEISDPVKRSLIIIQTLQLYASEMQLSIPRKRTFPRRENCKFYTRRRSISGLWNYDSFVVKADNGKEENSTLRSTAKTIDN